ncbi:MAG: hypothetical protein ACON35_08060 [Candidatus Marinamargulisbacteria bacterium]
MRKTVSLQCQNLIHIANHALEQAHPGLEIGITIHFQGYAGWLAKQVLSHANLQWALVELFKKHDGCLLEIKERNGALHWKKSLSVSDAVRLTLSSQEMPINGSKGLVRIKRSPSTLSIRSLHHLDGASGQLAVQEIIRLCLQRFCSTYLGMPASRWLVSSVIAPTPPTSQHTILDYTERQQRTYHSIAYQLFLDDLFSQFIQQNISTHHLNSTITGQQMGSSQTQLSKSQLIKLKNSVTKTQSGKPIPTSALLQMIWLIALDQTNQSTIIRVPYNARKNQPHAKCMHYVATATLFLLTIKDSDTLQTLWHRSKRYRQHYFRTINNVQPGMLIPAETILNDLRKKVSGSAIVGKNQTELNALLKQGISEFNFLPRSTVNPTRGVLKTTPYWGVAVDWASNLYKVDQSLTVTECDNGDVRLTISAKGQTARPLLNQMMQMIHALNEDPQVNLRACKSLPKKQAKNPVNSVKASSRYQYIMVLIIGAILTRLWLKSMNQ